MTLEGILAELDAKKDKMIKEIKESQDNSITELKQEFEQLKMQLNDKNQKLLKEEVLKEFTAQFSKKKLELIHKTDMVKLTLLNSLLEESKEKLNSFVNESSYSEFLNKSIKAILEKYHENEAEKVEIHVRKQDKTLLKDMPTSIVIVDDLSAIGGVKLNFVDKQFIIDDTLETRFDSARRNVLQEVNQMIFSDIEVPKWREKEIISQILPE